MKRRISFLEIKDEKNERKIKSNLKKYELLMKVRNETIEKE